MIRRFSLAFSLLAVSAIPALASVTVNTPSNGAQVSTQFTLSAYATTCSNQPVSAMGFSLDSSSNTTIVHATSIDAVVTSPTGSHTLHVKAWGNRGASCVTDVALRVATAPVASAVSPVSSSNPPSNGVSVAEPLNNATVPSPFTLQAAASSCSSQPVGAMGYSLDNSSNTAIVKSNSVAASITAPAGAHTLHVKAWGNSGAACVANIAIKVVNAAVQVSAPPPASGGVTVTSPSNGASVTSPFNIAASASACSSQKVASIGYGLDNASKTIATGGSFNTQISASAGSHTLHVTAWGSSGSACSASVVINVTGPASPVNSVIPSDAISVSSIQTLGSWEAAHDPAAGSSSNGTMSMAASPSLSGNARRFNTSFSGSGGEIYHAVFGDDAASTNFFYDAWIYLTSAASNIANLEMDMNQVMENGQTVIYGFQCDGYSGTWDYTENAGTPAHPSDQWVHSSAPCEVSNWTKNAWHHIQVSYSRDDAGNVTYHSVWLDGHEQSLNATVPSSFALGWGQVLLTNFQVDGRGSGSNTVYLDKLTISRW